MSLDFYKNSVLEQRINITNLQIHHHTKLFHLFISVLQMFYCDLFYDVVGKRD
jgi:hypothetical protein